MLNPGPVLARGRAAAAALMVDTCLIERAASTSTDGETGQVTHTWTTVYSGPCRLQQPGPPAGAETVGEAQLYIGDAVLSIPIDAPEPAVEDRVTCTAAAWDTALVGRTWRVRGVLRKSFATARRVQLQGVDD